ncbi:hypothetical protein FBD94_25205 [Pedobacter hiemivivus]|uniref:Uncharacterized protein n=1 Tax=Pedobacter hiemivivus TaxID=2530454 RepID=A0A4U1FXS3_9SPHI|nr:hypothetical protein [Pedobacter hiemivivus]TKC55289.1 hypothetical protein FBD94_25205 [Pedobacter hiemivivus]
MIVIFFISCSKGISITEIKDKDLLIQASCKESSSDGHDQEYKVRIFPELKSGETIDRKITEQMSYNMDSCFYKMKGKEKQFPETVIPIANGIKNCFEYLIVFSDDAAAQETNKLQYESKYINNTTYQLIFK